MPTPQKPLSSALLFGAALNLFAACDQPQPTAVSSEPKPSTQTVKPKPVPSPAASTSTAPTSTAPAKDDFTKMAPLSDEQIVATLIALNQGEVDQAGVAVKTAKDERVKKFADHMTMDHSQWMKDVEQLAKKANIGPKDSDVTSKLKKDSEDLVSKLKGTSPDAFDAVYIDSQVTGHQQALDLIDQRIAKDVKNADLKKAVETARGKIQGHLDEAKNIHSGLGKGAPPGASAAPSASAGPAPRQ